MDWLHCACKTIPEDTMLTSFIVALLVGHQSECLDNITCAGNQ
jgi:hypothetical protein